MQLRANVISVISVNFLNVNLEARECWILGFFEDKLEIGLLVNSNF